MLAPRPGLVEKRGTLCEAALCVNVCAGELKVGLMKKGTAGERRERKVEMAITFKANMGGKRGPRGGGARG